MARRVLFVFAHQDDEIAAAARIVNELRAGTLVHCVFLTDGDGGRASATVRDEESRKVLAHLGVGSESIAFLGSMHRIRDGLLVENLERALQLLEKYAAEYTFDDIYCLAWEGGHQDHDAAHIVALALASRRGMLDRCWEMPLYRASRTSSRLFRALSPLPPDAQCTFSRISLRDGIRIAALTRFYRSQRVTWLGLLPETLLHLVILRRTTICPVDPARLHSRPHQGRLFYEWRFKFPYERFARAAAPFLQGSGLGSDLKPLPSTGAGRS